MLRMRSYLAASAAELERWAATVSYSIHVPARLVSPLFPSVEERFAAPPPLTIWHYTTQAGFLGIIKDRELWATDSRFLNDAREGELGLSLIRDALLHLVTAEIQPPHRQKVALAMVHAALKTERRRILVASFCGEGDLLSQWRAYGRTGGLSLGFRTSWLREICAASGWHLAAVDYSPDSHKRAAGALATEFVDRFNAAPNRLAMDAIAPMLNESVLTVAALIKSKGFSEEGEWRLIASSNKVDRSRWSARPGIHALIPFARLPLIDSHGKLRIAHAKVGPTPRPRLATQAAYLAVAPYRSLVECDGFSRSSLSYRDW